MASSTASKVLALVGLSLFIAPIAHSRPALNRSIQRQQPRVPISIREDIRLGTPDYQVFAPSAPTSGPQAIWKYGSCENTVRVLVSNIGDDPGSQATVTLNVYHPFRQTHTYTQRIASIDANDHVWVEFDDVEFNSSDVTWNYQLEASVNTQDANASNNSNTRSSFVTHSCS